MKFLPEVCLRPRWAYNPFHFGDNQNYDPDPNYDPDTDLCIKLRKILNFEEISSGLKVPKIIVMTAWRPKSAKHY